MLEEELDPRPSREFVAALVAARAAAQDHRAVDVVRWMRCWGDRDDFWVQLRTAEHWIARADT